MRITLPRILLAAGVAAFGGAFPSFLDHLRFFLSGQVSAVLIRGNWWLVGVNVALFLAFIALLRVRTSVDWRQRASHGIYGAFIVSLFLEMYGVPLTIFLGSGVVGAPTTPPAYIYSVALPGVVLALNAWMVIGVIITVLGMLLVAAGWWQVYRADGLVTDGLYAYSRNPQYLGIILIGLGWVVGWPTLLTLALFPVLVVAYVHLAQVEARELRERDGDTYQSYAADAPLLI